MPDDKSQTAADLKVSALAAALRRDGHTEREIWTALLSVGATIGRQEIGHKRLAQRLRALAHDLAMQAVQMPQRVLRKAPPPPTAWRTWKLSSADNDDDP